MADRSRQRDGFGTAGRLFKLEEGEYLSKVWGTAGHTPDNVTFVASMTLATNKRTIGTFGSPAEGKKFLITPPNGREIRGFPGRRSWYIDAIGIIVRPIPKP